MTLTAEIFPTVQVYHSSAWTTVSCITMPSLHVAENEGSDVTFTVGCNAANAAMLTPGARLRLWVTSASDIYFDGFVSTAAVGTDGVMTVKAVDLLTLFQAMGTTLYRDFYNSVRGTANGAGSYDSSASAITLDLGSSDYKLQSVSDMTFNANNPVTISSSGSFSGYGNPLVFTYVSHGFTYFRAVKFTVVPTVSLIHAGSASISCNGTVLATASWGSISSSGYVVTLDAGSPTYDVSGKVLTITVNLDEKDKLLIGTSESASDIMTYTTNGVTHTVANRRMAGTWYGYNAKTVTAGYQSGSYVYATAITDVTIDSSALDTTFSGALPTAVFSYRMIAVYTSGYISSKDVIHQIISAIGFAYSDGSGLTGASLSEYRAAGGAISDHLQTLSEANLTGEKYFSLGAAGQTVYIGARLTKSDTATYAIVYGGDSQTAYTGLSVISASPNISIVNRHPVCVAKGTSTEEDSSGNSSSFPIIVACVDGMAKSATGLALADLASDGSMSTRYACASAALSKVTEGRANEWSGTYTVSGVWRDLISREAASYGSGVPVRIYYSPIGLSAYAAKVREITISWADATTAITVNNYSVLYANRISDSSGLSLRAANYAVNTATADSFTTQYIIIYATAQELLSSGNQVRVDLANGTYGQVTADVFRYPDLGTATIVAIFLPGTDFYDVKNSHSVISVKVNSNATITIDEAQRPDKRRSQTLIVNIITPI